MAGGAREFREERWFEEPMDWVGGYEQPSYDEPPPPPPSPPPTPGPAPELRALAAEVELLVVGRFLPLHRGHVALLEQAARARRRMTVVVVDDGEGPARGEVRAGWLRQLGIGDLEVRVVEGGLFDARSQSSMIAWGPRITAQLDERPRVLVTTDAKDKALSEALGVKMAQLRREHPVTSAQIRADPTRHWEHLAAPARAYFVQRVCLIGPEGTGKTTLASRLATHFKTRWVPEALRSVMIENGLALRPEHVDAAARKFLLQSASEGTLAGRVLFLDTDLRALALWSDRVLGHHSSWLAAQVEQQRVDLYLLPGMLALGSTLPEVGVDRDAFYWRCKGALAGLPHVELLGALDDRLGRACAEVDALLARPLW